MNDPLSAPVTRSEALAGYPDGTRWTAAAVLALMVLSGTPVFAGQGGSKGKPGDGDGPQYMPPFVEYRVTWVDLPAEMGTDPVMRDINRDGFAVGGYTDPNGFKQGLLVHSDGDIWSLNEVFAEALLDYPGWRFVRGVQVNAAGKIAGVLLPDDEDPVDTAPDVLIVCADLYADPPSLEVVDRVLGTGVEWCQDMNEAGDMLMRFGSDAGVGLYRAPYTDPPEIIEGPLGAVRVSFGNLNGAGQISLTAYFTELVSINRKKTEERTVSYTYLREPDGTFRNLEYGGPWPARLSEEGTLYQSRRFYSGVTLSYDPIHRWNEDSGWEPVTPDGGRIMADVSKEAGGKAEALDGYYQRVVYREGYGAYRIEVTSGLNGSGDLERWIPNPESRNERFNWISRREEITQAGYICDEQYGSWFILTPTLVAP